MVKKIRNDAIFKKPITEKTKRSKKVLNTFTEKNKNEYKEFYIFSLASIILMIILLKIKQLLMFPKRILN